MTTWWRFSAAVCTTYSSYLICGFSKSDDPRFSNAPASPQVVIKESWVQRYLRTAEVSSPSRGLVGIFVSRAPVYTYSLPAISILVDRGWTCVEFHQGQRQCCLADREHYITKSNAVDTQPALHLTILTGQLRGREEVSFQGPTEGKGDGLSTGTVSFFPADREHFYTAKSNAIDTQPASDLTSWWVSSESVSGAS